ncbi:MAG: Gfo/Idh/MocA family oxidoreductase [Kiritimatiellales bacterium]|nr:Gfo/Idh/MocA family oxidoreductase [Kiritimatiellales bacterium]
MNNTLSRRTTLKTAAATAGAFTLPRFSIGKPGPSASGKVNVAFIGSGGIAKVAFSGCQGENYVAMCDVDDDRASKNYKDYPDAPKFKDFRVMLDKMGKDIDAVVVSTPDHHHFPAAMEAMQRGKHVYVQKPLAHDIWQLRTLKKAAHKYNVITQMGNQGHATEGIRLSKEWYDAGVLGDVREVFAWFKGPTFNGKYFQKPASFPPKGEPVPGTLDWDLWLGQTPVRPYSSEYIPETWRGYWDFGTGEFGDWACHTLDTPCWALDLGAPTHVSPKLSNCNGTYVPDWSIITMQFPARGSKPPVKLTWFDGGKRPDALKELGLIDQANGGNKKSKKDPFGNGMLMVGDKKTLLTGGRPDSPKLVVSDDEWLEFRKNLPAKTIPRIKGGPFVEWLDAIKGGPMPGSNFDYAARLTEIALVGVIAQRTGKTFEWDGAKMEVKGDRELTKLVKLPRRKGWNYGEDLW